MKKIIPAVLVFAFVLCASGAKAQSFQRGEVFGGYSYVGVESGGYTGFAAGFAADAAVNVTNSFSVEGDFGFHDNSGIHLIEFLGGPRFTIHSGRTNVFFHALVGGVNASVGGFGVTVGTTLLTFGGGAGVDIGVNNHISIRAIQADALPSERAGTWATGIKLSSGVVFHF
jgi:hypothetical protein